MSRHLILVAALALSLAGLSTQHVCAAGRLAGSANAKPPQAMRLAPSPVKSSQVAVAHQRQASVPAGKVQPYLHDLATKPSDPRLIVSQADQLQRQQFVLVLAVKPIRLVIG